MQRASWSKSTPLLSPRRTAWVPVLLGALAGCESSRPVMTYVGESPHFRLFVDDELVAPVELAGENGLAALETVWADVATMIQMPDGRKIDYYWIHPNHIQLACGNDNEEACTNEDNLEILAPTLPHEHELNHAFAYLRTRRQAVPFVAEGIAGAIACVSHEHSTAPPEPDWASLVGALPTHPALYAEGARFARHLIRTRGAPAFLDYYAQSPERRDPALFAANFEAFWGTSLDALWIEMHGPNGATIDEGEICPCALSPLEAAGAVPNDEARAPYWPLPPSRQTIALRGRPVIVRDCLGLEPRLRNDLLLVRLGEAPRRYVSAPLHSATIDDYVSDRCEQAALYEVPPDLQLAGRTIQVALPSPPTGEQTVYVRVAVPAPAKVLVEEAVAVCESCDFERPACQHEPGSVIPVEGTFYARLRVAAAASVGPVVTASLEFEP